MKKLTKEELEKVVGGGSSKSKGASSSVSATSGSNGDSLSFD